MAIVSNTGTGMDENSIPVFNLIEIALGDFDFHAQGTTFIIRKWKN